MNVVAVISIIEKCFLVRENIFFLLIINIWKCYSDIRKLDVGVCFSFKLQIFFLLFAMFLSEEMFVVLIRLIKMH